MVDLAPLVSIAQPNTPPPIPQTHLHQVTVTPRNLAGKESYGGVGSTVVEVKQDKLTHAVG